MNRFMIYYIFCFLVNSGVVYAKNETTGTCQNYIDKYNSNIPKYFVSVLNKFDFREWGKVIKGIKKGDLSCFEVGGVLLNSTKYGFGHYTSSLSGAFSTLLQNNPLLFNKYLLKHPLTDESIFHVFKINYDKIDHFKKTEILDDISKRKKYIDKYLKKDFEDKLMYSDVLEQLKELSMQNIEVFKKDGTRIVYTSSVPYLISDKAYMLSNLVDDNKRTAWCVDYNQAKNYKEPLIKAVIYTDKYICNNKKHDDKCYVSDIKFSVESGYQKNSKVFTNNSRLKLIRAELNYQYRKTNSFSKEKLLSDAPEKNSFNLKIKEYIEPGVQFYVDINTVSIYEGKKYNDLCITSIDLELRK